MGAAAALAEVPAMALPSSSNVSSASTGVASTAFVTEICIGQVPRDQERAAWSPARQWVAHGRGVCPNNNRRRQTDGGPPLSTFNAGCLAGLVLAGKARVRSVRFARARPAAGTKIRPPAPFWHSFSGDPPPLPKDAVEILDAPEGFLRVARWNKFLNAEDIALVHEVASDSSAWDPKDRHDGLNFHHQVWRIEEVVRARCEDFYRKLTDAAETVDRSLWRGVRDFACPEIEYIEYDVEKLGRPGSIAKHTDNESVVSMVVMLSDPSEYVGGLSCFRGRPARKVALQKGDAVFFQGHRCEHWITPVTEGRRVVLQMELRDLRLSAADEHGSAGALLDGASASSGPTGRKKKRRNR